ncbi:MAG: AraC family transcriptional regulator [Acidobacteriota bacterium]
MLDHDWIRQIDTYAESRGGGGTPHATDLEGLTVLRCTEPTVFESMLYSPSLCLILQGSKETSFGEHNLRLCAGDAIVVSHHIPVVARVTEASERAPYLALVLELDLSMVRNLDEEVGDAAIEPERARALAAGRSDADLLDAMKRLFALVTRPLEAKVMAPMIRREVHFRLLLGRQGGMLLELLQHRSHASRITRAIAQIRRSYAKPLAVAQLARVAGMSESSFYEHFKSVTATTPIQYRKELRLLEGRRMLRDGTHSVAEAAFEVGYESPAQFSREYSRKFGRPPRNDLSQSAV